MRSVCVLPDANRERCNSVSPPYSAVKFICRIAVAVWETHARVSGNDRISADWQQGKRSISRWRASRKSEVLRNSRRFQVDNFQERQHSTHARTHPPPPPPTPAHTHTHTHTHTDELCQTPCCCIDCNRVCSRVPLLRN